MSTINAQQNVEKDEKFLLHSNILKFILPKESRKVYKYKVSIKYMNGTEKGQRMEKNDFLWYSIVNFIMRRHNIEDKVVYYGYDFVYSCIDLYRFKRRIVAVDELPVEINQIMKNIDLADYIEFYLKTLDPFLIGGSTAEMPVLYSQQANLLMTIIKSSIMRTKKYMIHKDNLISQKDTIIDPDDVTLLRRNNFAFKAKPFEFKSYFPIYSIIHHFSYTKREGIPESLSTSTLKKTNYDHFPVQEYVKTYNNVDSLHTDIYVEKSSESVKIRFKRVYNFLSKIGMKYGEEPNSYFKEFGIQIGDGRVEAKQIEIPKVVYGSEEETRVPPLIPIYPKYFHPAEAFSVYTLYGCPLSTARSCMETLKTMAEQRGMTMNLEVFQQYIQRNEDILVDLRIAADYKKLHNIDRLLIFVIYDGDDLERLNVETDLFEYDDVVTQRIVTKMADSIISRNHVHYDMVLNEMNLRMGGTNYDIVPDPNISNIWISNKEVLVVGYYLAIPSLLNTTEVFPPKYTSNYGIFGYSSNCYENSLRFRGYFHYQSVKEVEKHVIKQTDDYVLQVRFDHMFRMFYKTRGKLPKIVFIYRNEVPESRYHEFEKEVDTIYELTKTIYREYNEEMPKFVIQVVHKYHRFKFCRKTEEEGYVNSDAGTVIDSGIVRTDITEFYVQSHICCSGGSLYSRIHVLRNDLQLTTDQLVAYFMALSSIHQKVDKPTPLPEPLCIAIRMYRAGQAMWNYYTRYYNRLPGAPQQRMYNTLKYFPIEIDHEKMTSIMGTKKNMENVPSFLQFRDKFLVNCDSHVQP